jgi:hypothetical protein
MCGKTVKNDLTYKTLTIATGCTNKKNTSIIATPIDPKILACSLSRDCDKKIPELTAGYN